MTSSELTVFMIVGLMREVEVAIESKKSQTRGCLNVEESGKVVADEWLHHLRSTREGSRSRISPTKQAIATDHLLFTCYWSMLSSITAKSTQKSLH